MPPRSWCCRTRVLPKSRQGLVQCSRLITVPAEVVRRGFRVCVLCRHSMQSAISMFHLRRGRDELEGKYHPAASRQHSPMKDLVRVVCDWTPMRGLHDRSPVSHRCTTSRPHPPPFHQPSNLHLPDAKHTLIQSHSRRG